MYIDKKIIGFVIFGIYGVVFLIISIISFKKSQHNLNSLKVLESSVARIAYEKSDEPSGRGTAELVCLNVKDWRNAFGVVYDSKELYDEIKVDDTIKIYFIPNEKIDEREHNFDVYQIEKGDQVLYGIDDKCAELKRKAMVYMIFSFIMFLVFIWGVKYSK